MSTPYRPMRPMAIFGYLLVVTGVTILLVLGVTRFGPLATIFILLGVVLCWFGGLVVRHNRRHCDQIMELRVEMDFLKDKLCISDEHIDDWHEKMHGHE